MCQFVSWVKKDRKVYFLTGKQVFCSSRGDALRAWCKSPDGYIGHGAIRWFYGLEESDGTNGECTDFITPKNFPKAIAKAIKSGAFAGLGITPEGLLSPPALVEHDRIRRTALAEYKRIERPAWAEYRRIGHPALAEYRRIEHPALAEYERIERPAWAEYERTKQSAFWDLFAIPENRVTAWR
jgi:hypothetical protein